MYDSKKERFQRGELLKANQLNELIRRIERLEGVSTNNLIANLGHDGISIALPSNIPEIEFIIVNENVTADESILFEGTLLDQDNQGNFTVTHDNEKLYFRNLFRCTTSALSRAVVMRFPRGNGEWVWIPKACEQSFSG